MKNGEKENREGGRRGRERKEKGKRKGEYLNIINIIGGGQGVLDLPNNTVQ
jgi:hypothetical protein